jgi:hypothetical protein
MNWSDGGDCGDGCGGDTICQVEISRELTLQGIVGRNEYMRTEKHDADHDAFRCVFLLYNCFDKLFIISA